MKSDIRELNYSPIVFPSIAFLFRRSSVTDSHGSRPGEWDMQCQYY
jgi:acyl-CoA-binding protein